jgi:predicted N-acetyltransferase YhbS
MWSSFMLVVITYTGNSYFHVRKGMIISINQRKGSTEMIWEKDDYTISSERRSVDIDALHDMLKRSYWAKDRSREAVEKSVETSLCFSLLWGDEQIGFVRVLTDTMAYAIILDMIIREEFRGQGLGKWLMQCICDHPEIKPLRQALWTGDADDFYRQTGFKKVSKLKFMARNWVM